MKIRALMTAFAALAALTWGGAAHAARVFVDNTLGDVPADQAVTVAEPRPVQLIIEFKTSGSANARATRYVTPIVTELVTQSGYFSQVSTGPAEGGAILSIVIDNIPQADAASRGFGAGLTFGLVGTTVADYYVGSAEYVRGADTPSIRKEARHTMITAIGNTQVPENTTRARNADEAINTIMRQLILRTLHDLVSDPAFTGAPAAETPATTEASTPADAAAPAGAAATPPAEPAPAAESEAQPAPAN